MLKKAIILYLFLSNITVFGEILPIPAEFRRAISKIESNNNDFAVGDAGKAISRYQIHKICFIDAQKYDKSLQIYEYKDVTNKIVADKVLTAYLNKYCARAIKEKDFEIMARTWNGGPNGKNKQNTIKYWKKIEIEIK